MGKFFKGFAILAAIGLIGAAVYLKTPSSAKFDSAAAIDAASAYDVRIIRDKFGVPHIYGARDADVAFGLAYAHAEDDWDTIEDVIFFSRGTLAQKKGRDAAIPDYLVHALRIPRDVKEKYERALSSETRALVEAYAAGANLWCAEKQDRCSKGVAPVTGYDVISGFVSRTPFFYGLDAQLKAIFEGDVKIQKSAEIARQAFFKISDADEIGSNAMAVAPSRSADGHTRLMVNSHQPYTGPVAWYEARVKSEDGWDMIGGIFPGAPMILHGAGPNLGWAFTVNKPDLVDIYAMEVDDSKKPKQYKFDGEWKDFDIEEARFRVKLIGPFSLPVKRRVLYSVHGPVFVTDKGVFAVSYAGAGEIRSAEQWYRMNRAKNFNSWRSAMEMTAIPSFNVVYADKEGTIAYFYNAAIPIRSADADWSKAQPGDRSALLWQGVRDFSEVPAVVNPGSGYVVNSNHTPFEASGVDDNPQAVDFPPHFGIRQKTTNRGLRTQVLYGGDASITEKEFIAYKMDATYAEQSRVRELVRYLLQDDAVRDDPQLTGALTTLSAWNGEVSHENRSAALAVLTAQKARGYLLDDIGADNPDPVVALREVSEALMAGFGRVDPTWGEVVQLQRGDKNYPVNGGPDTLRAVYPSGDPADGQLTAAGGDTYILYADWPLEGDPEIKTIHQFGAASLDQNSPHFGDQAPIFAREEWKTPPMALDALLAEATADYRPGRTGHDATP